MSAIAGVGVVVTAAGAQAQPGMTPPSSPPPGVPPGAPPPSYGAPPPAYAAPPPAPVRAGWFGGVDIGFGLTHGVGATGNDTKNGLSGPNLTVGTFVSPALALGLRATSTTIWIDNGGSGLRVNNLFVGPVLQRWVTPSLFTTVGLGLAMIETAVDGAGDSTTGVGLDARLGWEVSPGAQSGWHVAIEVAPAFYEINGNPLRVTSIGFQIGWQHY